jgi:hypothetical protein
MRQNAAWHPQTEFFHGSAKQLAILGARDRFGIRADHLDFPEGKHATLVELHRQVQGRLTAERRQKSVGALNLDDAGESGNVKRLDVRARGKIRVGHDRGRVAVDQHNLKTVVEQHLAGLCAGIIEFTGLADDDGSGADDENLLDICAARHLATLLVASDLGTETLEQIE